MSRSKGDLEVGWKLRMGIGSIRCSLIEEGMGIKMFKDGVKWII
jgi:hypothetical protein